MARLVPADPFDLVIFGGTGDLATRKLLPALYHRDRDGQISADSRIIAVSRGQMDRDTFLELVQSNLQKYLKQGEYAPEHWERFAARLQYVAADGSDHATWGDLVSVLDAGRDRVRVVYLATSPGLYGPIAQGFGSTGLISERIRIVLEKPVGRDFDSARQINDQVCAHFAENQVFRIDHYLGKETVQNLLALRFGNTLFEPLWRRGLVDHVQVTVAEEIGVAGRGEFYDNVGALRDMVQNHLLQLVCLVAMEAPTSMDHDAVRDEKLKVLRALKPMQGAGVKAASVRGQYTAGALKGVAVPGYLEELGRERSSTETFVALKLEIENWRWSGVPFYVRTGKRLNAKHSEIVIQFQQVPHSIFPELAHGIQPNRLLIRLQPDEGVRLAVMAKEPGPGGFDLRPVSLELSFEQAFGIRYPDAYERLLMDVIRGNPALFMRRDEVETAWQWVDGIIEGWATTGQRAEGYVAGSWGPASSAMLLDRDGRAWYPESA